MQERDRSIEYLERDNRQQSNRAKECITKEDVGNEELVELDKLHDDSLQNESKNSNHVALTLLRQSGQFKGRPRKRQMIHCYRSFQTCCYNFLERPTGWLSFTYHITLFLLVILSLILSVLFTVKSINQADIQTALAILEVILLVWFTLEYIFRLWSAGCRSSYVGFRGRIKFAIKPFCLLDVAVILSTLAVITQTQGGVIHASAVRMLRFLQLLRLLRLDRRGGSWSLLGSVVYVHRQELMTTFYIGFLSLIFVSYLVYSVEQNHNPDFANFAEALWWGVVSLTTVGYGDKTPKTWEGRMIAAAFLLCGISFFALPAGILGSGFALKVTQQQRQKHFNRRRRPAAILMQCFWRLHAADSNNPLIVTWLPDIYSKTHSSPVPGRRTPDSREVRRHSSPDTKIEGEKSIIKPLTRKISLFARTPEMARKTDSYFGAIREEESDSEFLSSEPEINKVEDSETDNTPQYDLEAGSPVKRKDSLPWFSMPTSQLTVPVAAQPVHQVIDRLTPAMKHAIRLVRYLKLRVAVRKFKEARRPYDVKDVIEQYSAGHVEMLSRIKTVQTKVDDAFGDSSVGPKIEGAPKNNINTRLFKVEKQVKTIDRKIDFLIRIIELQGKSDPSLLKSSDHFGDGGSGRPSSYGGRPSPSRAQHFPPPTKSPSDGAISPKSSSQSKPSENVTLFKPLTKHEMELDVPQVVLTTPDVIPGAILPPGIVHPGTEEDENKETNNNSDREPFKEFKSKFDSRPRRSKPDSEAPKWTKPRPGNERDAQPEPRYGDIPLRGELRGHSPLSGQPSDSGASVSSIDSEKPRNYPYNTQTVPPNGHVCNVVENPTFQSDPEVMSLDSGVVSPRSAASPPPRSSAVPPDGEAPRPRLRRNNFPVYETTDHIDV